MIKINGIHVDAEALARGLLRITESLPDEYGAALALGMLPAPLFESLRKLLGEKYDQIAGVPHQQALAIFEELGPAGEDVVADLKESYTTTRKQFIQRVEREVALAMLRLPPVAV